MQARALSAIIAIFYIMLNVQIGNSSTESSDSDSDDGGSCWQQHIFHKKTVNIIQSDSSTAVTQTHKPSVIIQGDKNIVSESTRGAARSTTIYQGDSSPTGCCSTMYIGRAKGLGGATSIKMKRTDGNSTRYLDTVIGDGPFTIIQGNNNEVASHSGDAVREVAGGVTVESDVTFVTQGKKNKVSL